MEVALYAYYFDCKRRWQKGAQSPDDFENDFVKVVRYIIGKREIDRKIDLIESKKIIYLKDYEYDEKLHILLLHMISARHSKIRKVIDTDTLTEQKQKKKGKKDGDEEHTYLAIKFTGGNESVCLIAKNSNGVSLTKIAVYFDEFIERYHKDELNDRTRYKIVVNNIVSSDFINNLVKAKRIKGVTLTVEGEEVKISEHKRFSGKGDLKDDVNIILKPSGNGIFENTVKDFYKLYKERTLKRIFIKGEDTNGEPVTFDTEKMKEKVYVTIEETYTGEPVEKDIKAELKKRINLYSEV